MRRITKESYRKIFSGLLDIPQARLTININGVLCELLEKYGGQDVLDDINRLLKRGSIEITGSAKYHAFLPLLPEEEIERQIKLNEESLNKYFGSSWKKDGFFSPEMAYSYKVAKAAKKLGYKWIVMDELGFPEAKPSTDTIYKIQGLDDFSVFFRERNFSFIILSAQAGSVPTILRYLGDRLEKEEYIVTAMDGETFGHHRPGLEMLLFDVLKEGKLNTVMISDLPGKFSKTEVIEPRESTWAVTKRNMKEGQPFARWKNNENIIQQKQWELTDLAIAVVNRDKGEETRELLDRALHSDQYWWSSARPWWSLEMIERGAFELKSLILLSKSATKEERQQAESLYKEIIYTGFDWQRTGKVDEITRQENEEIAGRLDEKEKLFVTQEEYRQMIKTLREQMELSAQTKEYSRAAMIQDRIRELEEEMKKSPNQ